MDENYIFGNHTEDISIAKGALIIEKGIFPYINIKEKVEQIDLIAKEIQNRIIDEKDALIIIEEINNYLFEELKIVSDDDSHFLINVLDDNCGNCYALSCLYLSISERLDLPMFGVNSPEHMFVRYNNGNKAYSIGTTLGGFISEDKLIIHSKIHQLSIDNGIYLKELNNKEILAAGFNWRGIYFKNKGEYDLAISDYNKAIILNPNLPEVYSSLATAYKLKKDFTESIKYSQKALELNPNFSVALSNMASTQVEMGQYEIALKNYNLAIDIDSSNPTFYCKRGDLNFILKKYSISLNDYNIAIKLNPDDMQTICNRGTIKYCLADLNGACEDWNASYKMGYQPALENIQKFCD